MKTTCTRDRALQNEYQTCKRMSKISLLAILVPLLAMVSYAQEIPALPEYTPLHGNSYAASPQIIQNSIFKRQYGSASPARALKAVRGTANAEAIISSQTWKTYERNMVSVFGANDATEHYLERKTEQWKIASKAHNIANTKSLNIKGDCAEAAMDAFYEKDGWEKLDGKRGRNGFDGLYVKRNAQGRVVQWIPVDAKAGSSKLSITQRGKQLSPEWIKANLEDLTQNAEAEGVKSPTLANKQRLADLKALKTAKMRKPRIFSKKVKCVAGETHIVMQNTDINGKPVSKPLDINMQSSKGNRVRRQLLRQMEASMSGQGVKDPHQLVKKMEAAMMAGKIKSDSDLHQFFKSNINDSVFRKEVGKRFGLPYRRMALAEPVGKWAKLMAWSSAALDSKLGRAGMAMLDPGSFVVEKGAQYAAPYIAKQIYGAAGKRVTEQASIRLASQFAKAGLGALAGVADVYFMYDAYSRYNAGEMTQTAFAVESASVALGTAGFYFFAFTKTGAAIGTAICPGLGSAAGTAAGVAFGVIVAAGNLAYQWYEGNERQKAAELEEELRHRADILHAEEQRQQFYREMREKGEKQIAEGWQIYNSAR